MEEKIYTCECGKEYTNIQAFRGHKSHCRVHHQSILTPKDFMQWQQQDTTRREYSDAVRLIASQRISTEAAAHKQQLLNQWILEQHTCEKCGTIMTEKFGSGRFCSRACANSKVKSKESRQKTRSALLKRFSCIDPLQKQVDAEKRQEKREEQYLQDPYRCMICNQVIPLKRVQKFPRVKTCSSECNRYRATLLAKRRVAECGGNINQKGNATCRHGNYQGIHLDSTYELVYCVWCQSQGYEIKRCTQGFPYMWEGKEHLYYPDFIVDGTYVEIKGYWTEKVQAKINAFPKDLPYKILYRDDLRECFNYCIQNYGKRYWEVLYE